MVANLVEKDMKRVTVGTHADSRGRCVPRRERSTGASAASRRSSIRQRAPRRWRSKCRIRAYRLKPGMYARVQLTVASKPDALTVPRNAIVRARRQDRACSSVKVAAAARKRSTAECARCEAPGRHDERGSSGASACGQDHDGEVRAGRNRHPRRRCGRDRDMASRDGMRVITTGAGALKDGDRIVASQGPTMAVAAAPATDGGAQKGTRQ